MELRLQRLKTDPFARGTVVVIEFSNESPLLRQSFVTEVQRPLATARVRNTHLYSGHSFRTGAATTAAAAGTPEWLAKSLGRWKGDAALG